MLTNEESYFVTELANAILAEREQSSYVGIPQGHQLTAQEVKDDITASMVGRTQPKKENPFANKRKGPFDF